MSDREEQLRAERNGLRDYIKDNLCKDQTMYEQKQYQKPFWEQKTFWIGALAIAVAVLGPQIGLSSEVIQTILAALGGTGLITLRQGVEKTKK